MHRLGAPQHVNGLGDCSIECLPACLSTHPTSSHRPCSGGLIKPGEPGSEGQCTITVASE